MGLHRDNSMSPLLNKQVTVRDCLDFLYQRKLADNVYQEKYVDFIRCKSTEALIYDVFEFLIVFILFYLV
jgi:hypothetical protein